MVEWLMGKYLNKAAVDQMMRAVFVTTNKLYSVWESSADCNDRKLKLQ